MPATVTATDGVTAESHEVPETPAAILRRAADHLDSLDAAAGSAPWQVDSELRLVRGTALNGTGSWRSTDEIATHDTDTYGDSDDTYRDDPEYREVRADFDLIVALRPAAGPLAAWLRSTADRSDSGNGIPAGRGIWLEPAVAVARAVLGETDGAL